MAYQPEIEKLERQYRDDPARFFAQLADVYRRRGRIDEALGMLRQHLENRPNYVSGLIVLGRCLVDQHNDGEAREIFERVLAVDREHIIALKALGEIGERTGDAAAARQWYQRLLEIDPMNEEAEAALGRLPAVSASVVDTPAAPALELDETPPDFAETPAAPPSAELPMPEAVAEAAPPPAPSPEPPPLFDEPQVEARTPEPVGSEPPAAEAGREVEEPSEAPWAPASFPEEEPVPLAPGPQGGDADDVSAWVEHPEELLNFEDGAGAAREGGDLNVEAFDESLGWGAGERVSRQITAADLEAAEHAHASDLAAPVQNLPGLEAETVPSEPDTPESVDGLQQIETEGPTTPLEGLEAEGEFMLPPEEPPAAAVASLAPEEPPAEPEPVEEDDGPSLAGLPVFFPPDDEAREPLSVEPQPEPVVTETMAELYARQGLVSEARETYRQLLTARPHDRRLAARLAELEDASPARDSRTVYAASATGGQSARSFLSDILGGRQSASAEAVATMEAGPAGPAQPVEVDESPGAEPMDEAFADEPEPRGEPTQPAKDDISLAAIFGEQAAPTPAPAPAPPPADTRPVGGFSFDEFFSSQTPRPSQGNAAARGPRDTLSDDEGEEAFRDWLKGLKS